MPNINKGKNWPQDSYAALTDEEYLKSVEFLEAMTAACAKIAYSDGKITADERRQFFTSARAHASLAIFSSEEVLGEFAMHEREFSRNELSAQLMGDAKITPLATRPQLGAKVLNDCRKMIVADGLLFTDEYRAFYEIKTLLGLVDPTGGTASNAGSARKGPPAKDDLRDVTVSKPDQPGTGTIA